MTVRAEQTTCYPSAVQAHQFLQYEEFKPGQRIVRDLSAALMNGYLGNNSALSRPRLAKMPLRSIPCWSAARDGTKRREWESEPISVKVIERELERGDFDYGRLKLTDPACEWLDAQVVASPSFHVVDQAGNSLKFQVPTTLGDQFPIVPVIDREGTAISSPQRAIQTRILDLRRRLVSTSDSFQEDEWFQNLRNLVSECVSLIDVTLHQVYYRAKYNLLPGWKFDKAKLGPPHGRRLLDKLGWVHAITGKHVDARDHVTAFIRIKDLRNHLQHFDPPCFCFTLEDIAAWLNDVKATAHLAWKIRMAVGSPLSVPLIRLLLAHNVVFMPQYGDRPRQPQPSNVGYGSCRWPPQVVAKPGQRCCSFCGKDQSQVERWVQGGGKRAAGSLPIVLICDECITLAAAVIHNPVPDAVPEKLTDWAVVEVDGVKFRWSAVRTSVSTHDTKGTRIEQTRMIKILVGKVGEPAKRTMQPDGTDPTERLAVEAVRTLLLQGHSSE